MFTWTTDYQGLEQDYLNIMPLKTCHSFYLWHFCFLALDFVLFFVISFLRCCSLVFFASIATCWLVFFVLIHRNCVITLMFQGWSLQLFLYFILLCFKVAANAYYLLGQGNALLHHWNTLCLNQQLKVWAERGFLLHPGFHTHTHL